MPVAQAAWYHKHTVTFHNVLAEVRQHFCGQFSFSTAPADPAMVLVPRATLNRFTNAVCYSRPFHFPPEVLEAKQKDQNLLEW